MFRNFLMTAYRNIVRHKQHSVINIAGLTIGLASCMLILVYINHERSFDTFHKKADRIFDLYVNLKMADNIIQVPKTNYETGTIIQQASPSVENCVRIYTPAKDVTILNNAGTPATGQNLSFADPSFFDIFSFDLLSGNKADPLGNPFSMVISQTMASKYFGEEDPVGKTLKIKTDSIFYDFVITGVTRDAPSNSTIRYGFLASTRSLPAMKEGPLLMGSQLMNTGDFKTYLLLRQAADSTRIRTSITRLLQESPEGRDMSFPLVNLKDIHLRSDLSEDVNKRYFTLFPLVAILILLLAIVNFMSLSTARSATRAKEIGVRKAAGASRLNIVKQFYLESFLYTSVSFILATGICLLCLPVFMERLNINIDPSFLFSSRQLLSFLILFGTTVLLAGSYPSLVLSGFRPIAVLKGKLSNRSGGLYVFKFFTVLQFCISIVLIICGFVVRQQLHFLRHMQTGINRDNIIVVTLTNGFERQFSSFKKELQAIPGVSNMALSKYAVYKEYDMFMSQDATRSKNVPIALLSIDSSFIPLLGIQWKQSPLPGSDLTQGGKMIINEAAAQKLGLPSNVTGSFIGNGNQKYQVSGVVRNFNFSSLQYAIQPLCMILYYDTASNWGSSGSCLYIKTAPHSDLKSVIGAIRDSYKKYDAVTPFNYTFLDEQFNRQYQSEDRLALLFNACSSITLFLAVIGLFGLSAFAIQQRTKEIGIRKVLGAGVWKITALLSGGFLNMVLIAILIAVPVAWLAMEKWLENFSYRIPMQWWIAALSALLVLMVAAITTGYHTIRLALGNPVTSLRTE